MTRFKDTAEWYTPDRALTEEVAWITGGHWKKHLDFLLPRLAENSIKSIIEFGCASGLLAKELPEEIDYTGIDKYDWFLAKARRRNPSKRFTNWDARNWEDTPRDLAMAWNFLKNFALDEWDKMLARILAAGRQAIFNVQIAPVDLDDGVEYPHMFVSEAKVEKVVAASGHEIVDRATLGEWSLPGVFMARDVVLLTRQIVAVPPAPKVGRDTGGPIDAEFALQVEGHWVTELERYALRWTREGDSRIPVLYCGGKRVTKPWHLKVDYVNSGDPSGASANTAD